jgi:hypothetical protein
MRDERKLDAFEASCIRLARLKSDYQRHQQTKLAQNLQSQMQISPK